MCARRGGRCSSQSKSSRPLEAPWKLTLPDAPRRWTVEAVLVRDSDGGRTLSSVGTAVGVCGGEGDGQGAGLNEVALRRIGRSGGVSSCVFCSEISSNLSEGDGSSGACISMEAMDSGETCERVEGFAPPPPPVEQTVPAVELTETATMLPAGARGELRGELR